MNTLTIVLFGMPRNIEPFIKSIEHKLLNPLKRMGLNYQVVGQLNLPDWIHNPRSGENGKIENPLKLTEIFPDVSFKFQSENSIAGDLNRLSKFGDSWADGFVSLSNLLHQQQSLITGTSLALDTGATHFAFIRPDLVYHDDFTDLIDVIALEKTEKVVVPAWQFFGGLNDRFSFAVGRKAAEVYGLRLRDADSFVSRGRKPLHSERLLAYSLGTRGISVGYIDHRASRCRIDGRIREEDFTVKTRAKWRTNLRLNLHPRSFA